MHIHAYIILNMMKDAIIVNIMITNIFIVHVWANKYKSESYVPFCFDEFLNRRVHKLHLYFRNLDLKIAWILIKYNFIFSE